MGFHLNVHFRMTPVNARGGGGAGELQIWKCFQSVKCNDTSRVKYMNSADFDNIMI